MVSGLPPDFISGLQATPILNKLCGGTERGFVPLSKKDGFDLSNEAKKRLMHSLKTGGGVLLAGAAYFLFVQVTGWGIPCIFYKITGRYCPGCGITRMFLALGRLDLRGAFQSNVLVMILLPFALVLGLRHWILYIKTGKTDMDMLEKVATVPALLLTLAFWVLRNLDGFSYLAPK